VGQKSTCFLRIVR